MKKTDSLLLLDLGGCLLLSLMGLQHSDCLLHFRFQGLVILEHVQQLRVVDLQQHTCYLSSEVRIHALDQREQPLTQHLLLFLHWSRR